MQWLIDLVIEAIGIPPVYITRENLSGDDWDDTTLTQDGNWHDLDLSGIVPVGASAVNVHVRGTHADVEKRMFVRPVFYTFVMGNCTLRTQVANISIVNHRVVGLDSTRKISYNIDAPAWALLRLGIKGWWL